MTISARILELFPYNFEIAKYLFNNSLTDIVDHFTCNSPYMQRRVDFSLSLTFV